MPLPSKVTNLKFKPQSKEPVWQGPSDQGPNGGVTYSLLSRYLACKERFRVMVVEGLKPREGFNHRLEFGNLFHLCEEVYGQFGNELGPLGRTEWERVLLEHCQYLCSKYRTDQEEINHWYEVCKALFPVYLEYWTEQNPDKIKRTPLLREQVFDVPYKLQSGRTVRLRGKWDGLDLVGEGNDVRIELDENKTKSQIDTNKIDRQLRFDLQTMMYLVCYQAVDNNPPPSWKGFGPGGAGIRGVRYNVVRRSAHKSVKSMMTKVAEDYRNGRIGEWFSRWDVEVNERDYKKFKGQCLEPILENLCDDYEWWNYCKSQRCVEDPFNYMLRSDEFPKHMERHFRYPYGVWNVTLEGGFGDVDEYLNTGSEVGLERVENLFPELE